MKLHNEPRGYKITIATTTIPDGILTLSRHEVGTWHGTEKADIVYFAGLNGRGFIYTGKSAEKRARDCFDNSRGV